MTSFLLNFKINETFFNKNLYISENLPTFAPSNQLKNQNNDKKRFK